jgi:hypothetical protein
MAAQSVGTGGWKSWWCVGCVIVLAVVSVVLEWRVHGTDRMIGLWLFTVSSALKDAYELKWPYVMLLAAPALYSEVARWCIKLAACVRTTVAGLVGQIVAVFATRTE